MLAPCLFGSSLFFSRKAKEAVGVFRTSYHPVPPAPLHPGVSKLFSWVSALVDEAACPAVGLAISRGMSWTASWEATKRRWNSSRARGDKTHRASRRALLHASNTQEDSFETPAGASAGELGERL